jgi:hypothetical protein
MRRGDHSFKCKCHRADNRGAVPTIRLLGDAKPSVAIIEEAEPVELMGSGDASRKTSEHPARGPRLHREPRRSEAGGRFEIGAHRYAGAPQGRVARDDLACRRARRRRPLGARRDAAAPGRGRAPHRRGATRAWRPAAPVAGRESSGSRQLALACALACTHGRARPRVHAARRQVPRDTDANVETRLRLLLWHLAGRWGTARPSGVLVPRVTQETLGELIAARRPTVSSALKRMRERGELDSSAQGWLLRTASVS